MGCTPQTADFKYVWLLFVFCTVLWRVQMEQLRGLQVNPEEGCPGEGRQELMVHRDLCAKAHRLHASTNRYIWWCW